MKKPSRLFIGLGLAALLTVAAIFLLPGYMTRKTKHLLEDNGFTVYSIGQIQLRPTGIILRNIALDKNSFSTIGQIRVPLSFGTPHSIVIDDIHLIGELGQNFTLQVDGYRPKIGKTTSGLESLVLSGARLDVLTEDGAIRLEAKGQLSSVSDGKKIDAVVSGSQNQLSVDTRWTMRWDGDKDLTAEIVIGTLRARFAGIELTRGAGWLNIKSTEKTPATVDGQVTAGLLSFGELSISDINLTMEGAATGPHVIFEGQFPRMPGASVTIDSGMSRAGRGTAISITALSTDDVRSLLLSGSTQLAPLKPITPFTASLTRALASLNTIEAPAGPALLRIVKIADGMKGRIDVTPPTDGSIPPATISLALPF